MYHTHVFPPFITYSLSLYLWVVTILDLMIKTFIGYFHWWLVSFFLTFSSWSTFTSTHVLVAAQEQFFWGTSKQLEVSFHLFPSPPKLHHITSFTKWTCVLISDEIWELVVLLLVVLTGISCILNYLICLHTCSRRGIIDGSKVILIFQPPCPALMNWVYNFTMITWKHMKWHSDNIKWNLFQFNDSDTLLVIPGEGFMMWTVHSCMVLHWFFERYE